jgi:hypothetical protein
MRANCSLVNLKKKKKKIKEGFTQAIIWGHMHNTSFSSQLMNGPNNLKCYNTLGWNGLPGTNTLAYSAHIKGL